MGLLKYLSGSNSSSTAAKATKIVAAASSSSYIASSIILSKSSSIINTPSSSSTTTTTTRKLSTEKGTNETPSAWQPNQTTTIYTKMQSTCPDVMKSYAQCVIQKQNEGILTQGVCEEEYQKLMDCFRMVRSSL